jgi:hypothetical protein
MRTRRRIPCMTEHRASVSPRRRSQVRRTALLLGAVSFAFYVSYLVFALRHGHL